jgi:N-acetylmuramoyl-L-alanine amidase-like protein
MRTYGEPRPTAAHLPQVGRRGFLGLVGAGIAGVAGAAGAAAEGTAAVGGSAAKAADCPYPYLDHPYLDRAAWGADESRRFQNGAERWPPAYYPLQTLTVHHTALADGSDHNVADPAAMMRSLYRNMTGNVPSQDYGDFGYHFLIDEAGAVYEGRYSGTDGTAAFDASGNLVTAAHIGGWNSGNLGIVVLGNFNNWSPTAAAQESLTQLLASIAGPHGLDPLGTTNYVNPVSGDTKTVPTISGHGNWAGVDCPGTNLKSQLPAIRADVAAILG